MAKVLRIERPLPDPILSPNSRPHWAAIRRASRDAKDLVIASVLEQGNRGKPLSKAIVTVSFILPDNRRRDHQNLIASSKAFVDGLTAAGAIVDDDLTHIEERYPKPTIQKGVRMTIIEVEELPSSQELLDELY